MEQSEFSDGQGNILSPDTNLCLRIASKAQKDVRGQKVNSGMKGTNTIITRCRVATALCSVIANRGKMDKQARSCMVQDAAILDKSKRIILSIVV